MDDAHHKELQSVSNGWTCPVRRFVTKKRAQGRTPRLTDAKNKDSTLRILAFCIPIALIIGVLFALKVSPFGEKGIAFHPLYAHQLSMISEFRNRIISKVGLFDTGSDGAQVNFFALYGFYLSSPLNWLAFLFEEKGLPFLLLLQTMLRAGFAGFGFAGFLLEKDKNRSGLLLAFSTAYALSGYFAAHFWDFTLADATMLLPFLLWGALRILRGSKPTLYVVALFLMFFSTSRAILYTGLFLLLFIPLLYLGAQRQYLPVRCKVPTPLRFLLFTLIAAGAAAIILLPTIWGVRDAINGPSFFQIEKNMNVAFSVFDLGGRLLVRTLPAHHAGMVNIYCGAFVLLLLPIFGACAQIPVGERAYSFVLLGIFHIASSVRLLDSFFSGGDPFGYAYIRQALPIVFLLLYMGWRVVPFIEELPKRIIHYSLMGVLSFLVLANHVGGAKYGWPSIFWTAVAVTVYALCLRTMSKSPKGHPLAVAVFLVVAVAELTYGIHAGIKEFIAVPEFPNLYPDTFSFDPMDFPSIEPMDTRQLFLIPEKFQTATGSFIPRGFIIGSVASALSVIAFLILYWVDRRAVSEDCLDKESGRTDCAQSISSSKKESEGAGE